MLPPLRVALSPAPGLCTLVLFIVAVVTLAGAAPRQPQEAGPAPRPGPGLGPRATVPSEAFELRNGDPLSGDYGKHKRQIFREQVVPHAGGRIPEEAFRADRLALNKLQQAGFAVPDGVQLDWRGKASPPGGHGAPGNPDGHHHAADPHATVIKILQPDEGRFAPPESGPRGQHTVDSTYLIRTPAGWTQHASHLVGLQRPSGPPLQLPVGGSVSGGPLRRPFSPPQQGPQGGHGFSGPHIPQMPQGSQGPQGFHSPLEFQHPSSSQSPPPSPPVSQNDGSLTPFPSPGLQPPPNVPPSVMLFHHKPQPQPQPPPQSVQVVHPLEVPRPPEPHSPSQNPQPPRGPRLPSRPSRPFHHMRHSLSPLIDIEVLQPSDLSSHSGDLGLFEGGALGPLEIGGFGESHDDSHAPDPFLLDVDWASVVPEGLLNPEQLDSLYEGDHDENLQSLRHLHSLSSF